MQEPKVPVITDTNNKTIQSKDAEYAHLWKTWDNLRSQYDNLYSRSYAMETALKEVIAASDQLEIVSLCNEALKESSDE